MMVAALSPAVRQARALAFGVPLALLGGALIGQFAFALVPCEMCVWQRWPHVAALLAAGLAFALPRPVAVRWLVAVAAGGILTSGLIGVYHAGVEYRWWAGPACSSGLGGAGDPMAAILSRPIVSCDQPQWTLGGVSLAGFNALISIAAAVVIFARLVVAPMRVPREAMA